MAGKPPASLMHHPLNLTPVGPDPGGVLRRRDLSASEATVDLVPMTNLRLAPPELVPNAEVARPASP